jgi:hypothetical protein
MMTESTQPQPELGPAQANSPEQQQAHRRRRRRRKNKSSAPNAVLPAQQTPVQQPAAEQPAAHFAAPAHPHRRPAQPGQPRKKKKFTQKITNSAPQPGNGMPSQRNTGKRKVGKLKGPREFVGPMDHSYRTANGNIADGPASTIQITNGGYSGYYQDSFAPTPAIPVRENAVTRIFCFIDDLFFQAKIQETARKLGVKVEFVKGDKEVVARLLATPEEERPALIVFDLNNMNAKPMTLIPKFKSKFKKATSIVGFLSHLQGDLKLKATDAGCDTVMPRSAFSQSLPNLLRRYGMNEEEEYAQQPV